MLQNGTASRYVKSRYSAAQEADNGPYMSGGLPRMNVTKREAQSRGEVMRKAALDPTPLQLRTGQTRNGWDGPRSAWRSDQVVDPKLYQV